MCVLRTPVYMCMRGAFRTVDLGSHDLYCNPVIVPFQTLDPEHCGILDLQFIGISLYCCFAGLPFTTNQWTELVVSNPAKYSVQRTLALTVVFVPKECAVKNSLWLYRISTWSNISNKRLFFLLKYSKETYDVDIC